MKIRQIMERIGIAILALIPITAILVMFEVPVSSRYVEYFLAGYLTLVLVLLAREIILDIKRAFAHWWRHK